MSRTQSEKNRGGGNDPINPQDFADRIRALPTRGGVDHEWHIYYDDTKPAELYGGTWEELGEGIFLRSTGTNGTTSNGLTSDGGSADAVVVAHSHAVPSVINASSGYNGQVSFTDGGEVGNNITTSTVGEDGKGKNLPPYKDCHIWRKVS